MKIRHHLRKWLYEIHWSSWETFSREEHAQHLDHLEDENLAVPEYHTGKVKHPAEDAEQPEESIRYDNVAIPEIHIPHKKR